MYILRPYQEEAVWIGTNFFKSKAKHNSIIVVPTGGGKALIIAGIAKQLFPEPCLVLQPTKEILEQNIEKFRNFGGIATIYSASFNQKNISQVTYATIGSIIRKKELFKDFKYIIVDECHFTNAKGGMYEELINYLDVKVLGLSVGPNSYVELFGGPFKSGFVGSIETAFTIAVENQLPVYKIDGIEMINFDNVMARGWNGKTFSWGPCKKIIRHVSKSPLHKITAHSNNIVLTENHSIYMATKDEKVHVVCGKRVKNIKIKYRPKIICPKSKNVRVGDVAIGDNGNQWECSTEKPYNMVDFAYKYMPNSRTRVVCDIGAIPLSNLPTYGNRPNAMALRWIKNRSIPLKLYKELSLLDSTSHAPELICVEGSKSTISPIIYMSKWAYILGFYLGNGWLCNSSVSMGRIGFSIKNSIVDKVMRELKSIHGISWKIKKQSCKKIKFGSTELRANNIFLYELIKHVCGNNPCYKKYIPGEWIISWPRYARLKLLEGLIDSDGYIQKENKRNKKGCFYTTTSPLLVDSLLSLLRSLGITGGKHLRKQNKGRLGGIINGRQIIGKRDGFSVVWSGNSGINNNSCKGLRKKFVHDQNKFSELNVKSNIVFNQTNYVYDLEMGGHPSFVASGFLVHNTATPYRLVTDGYGGSMLKFLTRTRPRIFKDVIYYIQNKTLFDAGYLSPLEYVNIGGFDISQVKLNTTGADFDDNSLKRYFNIINHTDRVTEVVKDLLNNKSHPRKGIIVFNRFVKEAQDIKDRLGNNNAEILTATTKKKDRTQIIKYFRNGNLKVILNVNILGIGFDYPELDTIVLASPTMSLAAYYQRIGRAIRPHPDKDKALIIDLCDNYNRFGKIEDLTFNENKGLYFISSKERQLTNVYYGKDIIKMPFGKYKDTAINRIPKYYLAWLLKNVSLKPELKLEIEKVV